MSQKSEHPESPSERLVNNIRRATRKRHSSEEKIRIVLDGLRGEPSIAELCRREGTADSVYIEADISITQSTAKVHRTPLDAEDKGPIASRA
jgi:transposase